MGGLESPMQDEKMTKEYYINMYKDDVTKLMKYIPYLEKKSGNDVSHDYQDGNMSTTMAVPVYDGTLLNFVKEAGDTVFMDRNYPYFYTRNRIDTLRDEMGAIEKADIMHMEALCCILSKYVLGGRTKAHLWKEGVENRIFLAILKKAKECMEFWNDPLGAEVGNMINSLSKQ